jgi:N-acetylglucosaminyldiphosphoundecaprenol N-acetyl-beta-D-mannosaminyltransferase
MLDQGKRSILGVGVSVVDYDAVVERVIDAASTRTGLGVTALAVHGVMTGATDPEQRYRLNRLHIVTPDGQPVRWALKLLHGVRLADRVYGPHLMERICDRAAQAGLSIFLYGSTEETLSRLSRNLHAKYPALRIVGAVPSQFRRLTVTEERDLRGKIAASGADVVFVGLGCPRQETFVYENVEAIARPLIAVGAAYDFIAGTMAQAPAWMQRTGLEWLFRLANEPKRLWRRYVILNPYYCALIGAQWLGLGRKLFAAERHPTAQRYG